MRHTPVVERRRKRVIDGHHDLAIECDIVNARLGDRILHHAVGRMRAEAVLEGRDVIIRQGGCGRCQRCRRRYTVHHTPPKALSEEFLRVVPIL